MNVQENFIDYQGSRLNYYKAGHGSTPLLLFHGFGQTYAVFDGWARSLESKYTLYSFDLYFHGQSLWPGRQPLEKSDWRLIIWEFLQNEKIDSFELAGFSLGGKFALATLEAFPEKVKKLILLAPDGIKTTFGYSLATYPIAIRKWFKSMILHPGRFYSLVRALNKVGLMNKGMLRFAESQMDTEEKRRRVYYSWVYFRHLKFNVSEIAALLNHHRIPLLLIVGKYDKVIPAKNMNRLVRQLDQKQFEIIEAGHNDVIENSIPFMTR